MSAADTPAFSSVEAHCSGRMEKAGKENVQWPGTSLTTRSLSCPLICARCFQTHTRVLVLRGRHPGNH